MQWKSSLCVLIDTSHLDVKQRFQVDDQIFKSFCDVFRVPRLRSSPGGCPSPRCSRMPSVCLASPREGPSSFAASCLLETTRASQLARRRQALVAGRARNSRHASGPGIYCTKSAPPPPPPAPASHTVNCEATLWTNLFHWERILSENPAHQVHRHRAVFVSRSKSIVGRILHMSMGPALCAGRTDIGKSVPRSTSTEETVQPDVVGTWRWVGLLFAENLPDEPGPRSRKSCEEGLLEEESSL
jgi:hypothetical protein